MSLVDLFQVFRMGPKSGMLILQHEDKRGVIYVHEGRLLDAFVVQGVARTVIATRDEAVLSLLAWHEACFVFRHDLSVVGRPTRIEHDAEWLVLESHAPQHPHPGGVHLSESYHRNPPAAFAAAQQCREQCQPRC
ncbi:MAG: DUF4388 domain-containing protein [Chloroflexaceae bacterium]|nr:DUF4388 domain-containing protein [Chloroflexaceae bacterium]